MNHKKKKLNIGFLIYTYDRIDNAKINMKIIEDLWRKSEMFGSIKIIHSYNGRKSWYPQKYLEDVLIRRKNPGHFQGAAELIDAGMKEIHENFSRLDYIIVLAADTWLLNVKYVYQVLQDMSENNLYLATCPWGLSDERKDFTDVGMAVDFFIINQKWAKKFRMFPIDFNNFSEKYWEFILYFRGGNVSLEKLAFARYLQAIYRECRENVQLRYIAHSKIHRLVDREPVHTSVNKDGFWIRKMYWPKMGLVTHHDPKEKQKILKKFKSLSGKNVLKLIDAQNFNYYLKRRGKERSRRVEWKE